MYLFIGCGRARSRRSSRCDEALGVDHTGIWTYKRTRTRVMVGRLRCIRGRGIAKGVNIFTPLNTRRGECCAQQIMKGNCNCRQLLCEKFSCNSKGRRSGRHQYREDFFYDNAVDSTERVHRKRESFARRFSWHGTGE